MLRKYLRLADLRTKLGNVTKSTIYEWMKTEGLPKPIRVGRRVTLWDECEVAKWMDGWAAKRIAA